MTSTQIFVIIVLALTSLYTIISVLSGKQMVIKSKNPRHEDIVLSIFYFGALFSVVLFLVCRQVSLGECFKTIVGNAHLSPLGILVLFLSMSFISIFLDYCGFFEYMANISVKHAGTSQAKLFIILYATVSILTVFTSNDIIILTFTPFIYYFTTNRKIDATPYLIAEFFAANTWSMALYIGNPTNILLSEAFGITFFGYLSKMILPTIVAGLANFAIVFIIFRKQLTTQMDSSIPYSDAQLKDKHGTIVGLTILSLCIVSLAIAGFIKIKTYWISCFFALLLLTFIILRMTYNYFKCKKLGKPFKNPILVHTFKKMPWNVIPFILSLSIIVYVANKNEICQNIANLLGYLIGKNGQWTVWIYGVVSTLSANVLNNIPMSVLFVDVIDCVPEALTLKATLPTIIGSNLGANITPIGALAGIMWITILKNHGFNFSFARFSKYGSVVTAFSLAGSLFVLSLIL